MSVIPGGQLQYVHVFLVFLGFFSSKNNEIVASSLHRTHILRYAVRNCLLGFYTASLFCPLCASVRSTRCVKSEGEAFALRDDGNWRGINLVSAFFETFQAEVFGWTGGDVQRWEGGKNQSATCLCRSGLIGEGSRLKEKPGQCCL